MGNPEKTELDSKIGALALLKDSKKDFDDRVASMKEKVRKAAIKQFVDDKVLAGGVFFMSGVEIRGYGGEFPGYTDVYNALSSIGNSDITLTIDKDEYRVRNQVRLLRGSGHMRLYLGDDMKLENMRKVVRKYGIRIDITGLDKKIAEDTNKHSWNKDEELRNLLIMSGAATNMPLSKVTGFEEYLEKEEEYARLLHTEHKNAVEAVKKKDPGRQFTPDVIILILPFDMLEQNGKMLFFRMGRTMLKQINKELG